MSLEFEQMAENFGFTRVMMDNGRYTLTDKRGDILVTVLAADNAATNNKRLHKARVYLDQQYSE